MNLIYVHGIGPKQPIEILKSAWDSALFNGPANIQTSMSYWVNRKRYPIDTQFSNCTEPSSHSDFSFDPALLPADKGMDELSAMSSEDQLAVHIDLKDIVSDPDQLNTLRKMQAKMIDAADAADNGQAYHPQVLPFRPLRRWITRIITKHFLRDVYDYLFVERERERMVKTVTDLLSSNPQDPHVIIAHSQGSMIAYDALLRAGRNINVPLFLTIGSPLGLQEVKDHFETWFSHDNLPIPEAVERWVNIADRYDPVAVDADLADDYLPTGRIVDYNGLRVNSNWHCDPHSATGYLSSKYARQVVNELLRR